MTDTTLIQILLHYTEVKSRDKVSSLHQRENILDSFNNEVNSCQSYQASESVPRYCHQADKQVIAGEGKSQSLQGEPQ